jgi:hypothetical protein
MGSKKSYLTNLDYFWSCEKIKNQQDFMIGYQTDPHNKRYWENLEKLQQNLNYYQTGCAYLSSIYNNIQKVVNYKYF